MKPLLLTFVAILLYPYSIGLCEERVKEMDALIAAYPTYLKAGTGNYLIWKDGSKMIYDDGKKNKTFEGLLDNGDLEDQMSMPYPVDVGSDFIPPKNFDPGRIRFSPFFQKMYGHTDGEVKRNLTEIRWMPRTVNRPVLVTTINDVHLKLRKVSDELDRLPDNLKKYVSDLPGTYNRRKIAGTDRPSMHSFGIAIDINTKYADYWQWSKFDASGGYSYKNRIPPEVVRIFENEGFIWGGRWHHFDTMHFEYRPELLPLTKEQN